jgi:hypothetical protein
MAMTDNPLHQPTINGVTFTRMAQYDENMNFVFSCDNCRKMGLSYYIKIDATKIALARGPESADIMIFDALKVHDFQHNEIVKAIEKNTITIHMSEPKFYVVDDHIEGCNFEYPKAEELKPRRMLRPNLIKDEGNGNET